MRLWQKSINHMIVNTFPDYGVESLAAAVPVFGSRMPFVPQVFMNRLITVASRKGALQPNFLVDRPLT
jgi:hypothetical protein